MAHDSQPYNRIYCDASCIEQTDFGRNRDVRISSQARGLQNAVQARLFLLFPSLALDDIIEPRHLSGTWLILVAIHLKWWFKVELDGQF